MPTCRNLIDRSGAVGASVGFGVALGVALGVAAVGDGLCPGKSDSPGPVLSDGFGLRDDLGVFDGLGLMPGDEDVEGETPARRLEDGKVASGPDEPGRRTTIARTATTSTTRTTASPWLTRRQSRSFMP
jgi:hypothetical protein